MARTGHKRWSRIFRGLILAFIGLVCLVWLIPLLLIVSSSLTEESILVRQGYQILPPKVSLEAYKFLWQEPSMLFYSYGVSLFVTVVGSSVSLLITSMLAYVISRRDFKCRNLFAFYIFFTMLFYGGLVPYYIVMTRTLHLKDSVWSMILPYLIVPFYVLLLRTYFSGLPHEYIDAAKIDGASEWRIFFQIVVPLSTPALATVGLFSILLYWNDMYQALLFIENSRLYPLQFLLFRLIHNVQMLTDLAVQQGTPVPHQSVRMAMAVLAMGPILFAFLFVQKYFIRGITLGGIKGD